MKTTKRRFEQFLFYDYHGIETHLSKMAEKGWQLQKITPFYWEYSPIISQKINYAVAYFSEASDFNPYPTKNQQTFHEYCHSTGWELAAEWAQMQIFCTQQENPIPIETDESVKLQAIHSAMKKNFLPSNIILLLVTFLQFFLQLHIIAGNPVHELAIATALYSAVYWSIFVIYCMIILFVYIKWHHNSRKSILMGGTCIDVSRTSRKLSYSAFFLIGISAVMIIFQVSRPLGWAGIIGLAAMVILLAGVFTIKNSLKKAGVSKNLNRSLTFVSCVVLYVILTSVIAFSVILGVNTGWFDKKPDNTYTFTQPNGATYTWDLYHDPLPLKVEDIQKVNYDHYSYKGTQNESFLLSQYVAWQNSFPDGQFAPTLNYAIIDVKLPILFNLCLNDYLKMYYDPEEPAAVRRYFRKTDDPVWQADQVYQLFTGSRPDEEYILCWGSRILYLNLHTIPEPDQIAVIVKKLKKNKADKSASS